MRIASSRFCRFCLAAACLLVSISTSFGQAEPTIIDTQLATDVRGTQNVKGIKGPGAVAVHARAGGQLNATGAVLDPAAGGRPFSDDNDAKIGPPGKQERAIQDRFFTDKIGRGLKQAYSNISGMTAEVARGLTYRVVVQNDKVAAAKTAPGMRFFMGETAFARSPDRTEAFARANQTVVAQANGRIDASGQTQARVDRPAKKEPAFAVALVNDPIQYSLIDPSGSGLIDLVLLPGFKLQAAEQGGYSQALFEFGDRRGEEPDAERLLLSFVIGIDFSTSSLDRVGIDVLNFDPVAFPDPANFVDDLRPLLDFDAFTHTLTTLNNSEILLHRFVIEPGSDPLTIRFDYGAIAGASVPEPGMLGILGLGTAAMVFGLIRPRRRASA